MENAAIVWERLCLAFCIFAPILACAAIGLRFLYRRGRSSGWSRCLVALLFAAPAIYLGATKSGTVTVSDDYIEDDGSYLTNDIVHVALAKKTSILPDDTEILVYARELSSTNSADWFQLTPELTFADHPYDYELVNATNYNVLVAANYTPAPTVHTNGVWVLKGFEVSSWPGHYSFGNSKIRKAYDPYRYQVEYIQSDKSSLINTGVDLFDSEDFVMDLDFELVEAYDYVTLWAEATDSYESWVYSGRDLAVRIDNLKYQPAKLALNTAYNLKIEGTSGSTLTITLNGASTTLSKTFQACDVMYLFGGYNNSGGKWKFYSLQLSKDGTLVREFIPVIDNDGVPALYDKVGGELYYNQGSGSFTAGPRVE